MSIDFQRLQRARWRAAPLPRPWPERGRLAAIWLFAVAVVVVAMVVVGGATRATGSGLSITRWDPIVGVLPPLNSADWVKAFALYKATPQYQLVNRGIGLADFQVLFWWEWAHRLLGRVIGVAFLAPFALLIALRHLPRRLLAPCAGLFLLGGLQGLAGWRMVQSGLHGRVLVAPQWLAIHLGLALVLLAGLVVTGLEAWAGRAARPPRGWDGWMTAAAAAVFGVFVQCLAGALVAGSRAGLVDADWPLMGGRLAPSDYWGGSTWTTLIDHPPSVQLHHRVLAYALVAFFTAAAVLAARQGARRPGRAAAWSTLAVLAWGQAALGVLLLRWSVPLAPALAHQLNAILLFAVAVAVAWASRRRMPVI